MTFKIFGDRQKIKNQLLEVPLKDKQGNDVISIAKKSGNKQLLKYLKKLVKLN
jgi:hypothetical protein